MEQADLIWMNGEFVNWEDAKVHVLTHGLHYGTGVFEGVRCYDTEIGPAVFRHADHLDRLFKSAELYYMHALPLTYNKDLQEDKEHLFDAVDTVDLALDAAKGMISGARFDRERMRTTRSSHRPSGVQV